VVAELKLPPAGVATSPLPDRPWVPLRAAATRLRMDHRTVQAAVTSGEIAGWARPAPQRLKWFVYEDQLPAASDSHSDGSAVAALRAEVAELRAQVSALSAAPARLDVEDLVRTVTAGVVAESRRVAAEESADLRATVTSLTETNLLLLGAQDDLAAAGAKYRQALGMFLTPGHPGGLLQD
jgi:hypothetical protein